MSCSQETRSYNVARDGAAWCATAQDFINLQESLAGFGDSPVAALAQLLSAEEAAEIERRKTIRRWICNACKTTFDCRHEGDGRTDGTGPGCPRCSCCSQYTYEVRQ